MSTQGAKDCPLRDMMACVEKLCAWWNFLEDECAVATLATLATLEINRRNRGHD